MCLKALYYKPIVNYNKKDTVVFSPTLGYKLAASLGRYIEASFGR
jgi:hypothetical protein